MEFPCVDPTIPSAWGPNFVFPCRGWTLAHLEKSHRACQTESKSIQAVALSLSPPPLKKLQSCNILGYNWYQRLQEPLQQESQWDLYLNQALLTLPFSDVIRDMVGLSLLKVGQQFGVGMYLMGSWKWFRKTIAKSLK
jgi:hypothetical protein